MSEPGGWTQPRAVGFIQTLCVQVKGEVERKTGDNYAEFVAVLYRCQVVDGENYLIKVNVGGDQYLHLFIFQALPCHGGGVELKGVQQHKKKDDPLEPFIN